MIKGHFTEYLSVSKWKSVSRPTAKIERGFHYPKIFYGWEPFKCDNWNQFKKKNKIQIGGTKHVAS